MKFIDLHCDTLMHLSLFKNETLTANSAAVDFTRMRKAGAQAQFFAICLPGLEQMEGADVPFDDGKCVSELIEKFAADIAADGNAVWVKSHIDLTEAEHQGKVSAFLAFEDGRMIRGSMDNLKMYHGKGVRLIGLTWNYENCFGYPCSDDKAAMALGLKPFGKEAAAYMLELGMIIDVSHLSYGGFWDIVDICKSAKKPFAASHSNAAALCSHRRNLTDEMIRAIGETGGCAGINFCAAFLDPAPGNRESRIKDMVKHAAHIKNTGGKDALALGSDLDGIGGNLEIGSIDKMPVLLDALKTAGFTQTEIEAAAYGNAKRVICEVVS